MRLQFLYFFKIVQIATIAFSLWRLLSETLICGSFVSVKEPLHLGFRGACKGLFFYVDPKRQQPLIGDNWPKRAQLRLWWFFDGSNFLPPPPTQNEVDKLVEDVKQELSAGRWQRTRWSRTAAATAGIKGDIEETNPKERTKSAAPEKALTSPENFILEEIRKKRNFGGHLFGKGNDKSDEGTMLFCYKLNMQGPSPAEAASPQTKGSPPIILANRSVVAVAVALAHFLLLFAQIYLLNCLEEDNFEQKRAKLFLELFVLILSCLSWLIVFLLALRTEFEWEAMWSCTNFRPNLLSTIIIVQAVAAVLILMGLFEGIRVFLRMQKYDRLIERMKQGRITKYRPRT